MRVASATEVHSRVLHTIYVDEGSIRRDRNGILLSFCVFSGYNQQGQALFSEYMASHSTRNPIDSIIHIARNAIAAAGFTYSSIAHHGDSAMAHGPAHMKAQALKGFRNGLLQGAAAVATIEIARAVLDHVTAAKYYIPVHGGGPDFAAPIQI